MNLQTKKTNIWPLVLFLIGLPIFFYATGDFARRTILKESISIITLLAFFLMLAQFFVNRTKWRMLSGYSMADIITIHKVIGYCFTTILLLHPFLIVIPRYFDSGLNSKEAFITMITTTDSTGIQLGIVSWLLMLLLVLTSFLRRQLPMNYKSWKTLHGILAALFTITACWHAIDLGRHTTPLLSSYTIIIAISGVLPLLLIYILRSPMEQGINR